MRTTAGVQLSQSPQFAPDAADSFAAAIKVPVGTAASGHRLALQVIVCGTVFATAPVSVSAELAVQSSIRYANHFRAPPC